MDNQNQNSGQIRIPENMHVRKKLWVISVAFIILILLIGAFFVWNNYLSPDAQRRIELEKNYEKYTSAMKTFEETMRADTYGGKTPQETLNMFIDALKNGDINLASKYFMLDTNTKSPDYLTRRKWENWLVDLKNGGLIQSMIGDIQAKSKPDLESRINENDFKFVLLTDSGVVGEIINMELNKYSQVWKIESM